ncbi:galaxin-like [Crassostrea angulata]|uniref:galaxin-like n=1 Tax=Magallana angulata TaxID=2784310 RepID=UPI0022B18089|nr:galaxin-like [Crassostrea angulata]
MEVAFHICIVFLVIFGGNTVNADRCLTSSGIYYNGDTKICCNGTLYDRNKDSKEEVGCCGDVIYNVLDKICCGPNSLRERHVQSGEDQKKEQICCGTNIFQVAFGMSCCGNNYTKSDGCCNQTTPFNRTHSRCVRDKVVPLGHDYCNGTLFNRQKQRCCEDSTLWNISSYNRGFRCCGSEVYDKRTKQCCRGSGERRIQPQNGQCCGTGLYDPSQELCCKNQVFPSFRRRQCCGKGTYDPAQQECCGGRAMTKGLQICCKGTIYTIDYKLHLRCCGNNVYYSTTHLCCKNGIKIEKTSPNHTNCCKRNATFYSCEKQEWEKADSVCGQVSFDKQSDLCCNNEIHRGAIKTGKRCCNPGTLAYDPRNQTCCYGEVTRKTESCSSPTSLPAPIRMDRQTSGICSLCSQSAPQRKRFINNTADVCRTNGYRLKIENLTKVSNLSSQLQISLLDVTVKANIYNSTYRPNKTEQHTLLIPSNCTNMDKFRKKTFLLLTDIVFHSSQNIVHLGDSDLIFPAGRKTEQIVKRRFKSCSSYIVRNIHKILSGQL